MQNNNDSRRGRIIGALLIVLIAAVLAVGGTLVWRAARAPKTLDTLQPEKDPTTSDTELIASQPEQPEPEPAAQSEPEPEPAPEPEPEPEPEPARVTLMALGDNLIHNSTYWSMELPDGGYDFTSIYNDIKPTVESYDIACINQETALVADRALIDNYPSFGTPQEAGDALAQAGFDVITQATNHCYDKGDTGVLDSIHFWRDNYPEITLLGIHDSQEDADTIRVVEKNGIRIAMLNYTYGLNAGAPADAYMIDRLDNYDHIASDIAKAKEQSDFVIVFAHWGEEDQTTPNDYQKTWAQFFADEGVDLVIGSHPHILQPLEVVTGKNGNVTPVFYSLGNFFSHQLSVTGMLGGMASVTIEKDADGTHLTDYELIPTMNVIIRRASDGWFDYRPMLLKDYTEEIAATHRIEECRDVNKMWELYHSIVD